ncbi:hypothetical protein BSPWISOXPB_6347 [uncultured Gammaproteobacteria bacterium]|nr:hypothetical protein BSPWISOXPB_6347 [uncultured Gammaproteobacteria bacterium]
MHPLVVAIPRFIQLGLPLPPLNRWLNQAWGDSDSGGATHPLVVAIPRFIQLMAPLPPLKPMAQSRRGVTQMLEAQVHPLVGVMSRFIQLMAPLPL